MRLAASTLAFRHDNLDTALQAIAAAGFDTIDLAAISSYCPHLDLLSTSPSDWDALAGTLERLSLSVATLNVGEGLLGDPSSEERAIKGYEKAFELAQFLGCYAVTIQSGIDPKKVGIEWESVADSVATRMRSLCDAAEARGLDVAVEIHKQMLVAGTQSALALAEKVNHQSFGYTLDPSHLIYAGERPEDSAGLLGNLVRHVHLRDAVGTNIMVVPGDGQADFTGLLGVLTKNGYARCCTIELEYEHAFAAEVQPDLERAKGFLMPLAEWTAAARTGSK